MFSKLEKLESNPAPTGARQVEGRRSQGGAGQGSPQVRSCRLLRHQDRWRHRPVLLRQTPGTYLHEGQYPPSQEVLDQVPTGQVPYHEQEGGLIRNRDRLCWIISWTGFRLDNFMDRGRIKQHTVGRWTGIGWYYVFPHSCRTKLELDVNNLSIEAWIKEIIYKSHILVPSYLWSRLLLLMLSC